MPTFSPGLDELSMMKATGIGVLSYAIHEYAKKHPQLSDISNMVEGVCYCLVGL